MADNKPRNPFAPAGPRKGSAGSASVRPVAPRGSDYDDAGSGQDHLAEFFADPNAVPASPDESLDTDSPTRVANASMFQPQVSDGSTRMVDASAFGSLRPPADPQGWRGNAPPNEPPTLTAAQFSQHMPFVDGETHAMMPPGIDPAAYAAANQAYYGHPQDPMYMDPHGMDPNGMAGMQGGVPVAEGYGLVPAGVVGGGSAGGSAPMEYSWLRINPPEHVGQVSPDLVMMTHPDGFAASQYRTMRLRLEQEPNTQIIVVTSAREGDGKSVTAANLALALAEGGRIQVLLVDASLRNPAQHKLFGIRGDLGLTSVLAARQDDPNLPIDVIGITRSLCLIPAGPPVASAHAALSSEAAAVLMGIIRREFRYIIVDSAPVYGTAETLAWHGLIDKYILVARAERSTTEDLTGACDRLQRDRILGVTFVGSKSRRR